MTCAPDLLQAARPADVATARRSAPSARRAPSPACRARRRASGRGDDRRVAARAVERLLDRQHVGVVGRGLDEARPPGRTTRRDGAAGRRAARAARRCRPARRLATGHAAGAAGLAQRRRSPADRPAARSARTSSGPAQRGRRRPARPPAAWPGCRAASSLDARLDLQPDDVAAAPLAQLLLDRLQEIDAALVVELELGVAREAEGGRLERRSGPGRATRSSRADDVLEQHERAAVDARRRAPAAAGRAGTCTTARRRWSLPVGRARARTPGSGSASRASETAARRRSPAASARAARRPGSSAERGARSRRSRSASAHDADAVLGQRGQQRRPRPARAARRASSCARSRDRARAARAGVMPAGVGPRVALVDRVLERGDAHHEELVEVRRDDRGEAQPLEQRVRRVRGLLEHAVVEREPRQLAVEEQLGLRLRRRFTRRLPRPRMTTLLAEHIDQQVGARRARPAAPWSGRPRPSARSPTRRRPRRRGRRTPSAGARRRARWRAAASPPAWSPARARRDRARMNRGCDFCGRPRRW